MKTKVKELPAETKEQILKDYGVISGKIMDVMTGKLLNSKVHMGTHYLEPKALPFQVPIDNIDGAYLYYTKVRSALEEALTTGSIPSELMPEQPPQYLIDIVRRP